MIDNFFFDIDDSEREDLDEEEIRYSDLVDERYYRQAIDDSESAAEHMARVAADIESGLAEVPRG